MVPRPPYACSIGRAMVPSAISVPPADIRSIRIPVRFPHVWGTPTQPERDPPVMMSVPQIAYPVATGMPHLPMTFWQPPGSSSAVASPPVYAARSAVALTTVSATRSKFAAAVTCRNTSSAGRPVGRRLGSHRPFERCRAVRSTAENLRIARFARHFGASTRIQTLDPCRLFARRTISNTRTRRDLIRVSNHRRPVGC